MIRPEMKNATTTLEKRIKTAEGSDSLTELTQAVAALEGLHRSYGDEIRQDLMAADPGAPSGEHFENFLPLVQKNRSATTTEQGDNFVEEQRDNFVDARQVMISTFTDDPDLWRSYRDNIAMLLHDRHGMDDQRTAAADIMELLFEVRAGA